MKIKAHNRLEFFARGVEYRIESDVYNVTLFYRNKGKKVFQVQGYHRSFRALAEWFTNQGFNSLPGPFSQAVLAWEELRAEFLGAIDTRLKAQSELFRLGRRAELPMPESDQYQEQIAAARPENVSKPLKESPLLPRRISQAKAPGGVPEASNGAVGKKLLKKKRS